MKIIKVKCRHYYASEATAWIIEAARNRNDQIASGAAADHFANVWGVCIVVLMILKILAISIIGVFGDIV